MATPTFDLSGLASLENAISAMVAKDAVKSRTRTERRMPNTIYNPVSMAMAAMRGIHKWL
jgi:hypothetical protein